MHVGPTESGPWGAAVAHDSAIDGAVAGSGRGKGGAAPKWAIATFAVLFVMHLLDYIDRNILVSILPQIRKDIPITNEKWGLLATIFLVSYSVFSPAMGWLGDRYK